MFSFQVLSEVLRLLKLQIAVIAEYKIEHPGELIEKLAMLLGRKLLDNKEPVVDNALHLAGQIIKRKGKNFACTYNISLEIQQLKPKI